MNDPPQLTTADNLRDVAGEAPGYPTRSGGHVRRGVLYRSNELQLDRDDVLRLTGLGLRGVLDLRTAEEVSALPDAVLPGADWHHFDVAGIQVDDAVDVPDRAAGLALMDRVYRSFVDDESSRREFGRFLTHLASTPGPQLFHCTTGKDRSGWAAALLLHIAGVPHDTIVTDYLLTNEYGHRTRARYLAMAEVFYGRERVAAYEPLFAADARYLEIALDSVAASYGDLDGYLSGGLGLSDADRDTLHRRLQS